MYDSTKYKACPPTETVSRIRRILEREGLETEETWTMSGVDTICSVRITLKGTVYGQNGKGTSREYALASGYAELMERLQCGYLGAEDMFPPRDRTFLSQEEAAAAGGKLLEETLRSIRRRDGVMNFIPVDVARHLEQWAFGGKDEKLAVIPFRSEKTQEICCIPERILRAYYFTNGSCAGNTEEEARIQGMSEIAERYAAARILSERLTPPVIPDEAFKTIPALARMIDTIRKNPRYSLRIMDASCGMGLPVAGMQLADRETGRVVVRFGAHPRPEIALERCLTECLQGRRIEKLENAPVYQYRLDEVSTGIVNRYNFVKAAVGLFPAEIAASEASWEYRPFKKAPEDIHGQLSFMETLFDELGWDLYIRDCSFLGFPSFQMLVLGISMVFDFGSERLVEKRRLFRLKEAMTNLAEASEETLREVQKLALMKRGFVLENTFDFLAGFPVYPRLLGVSMDAAVLAALCSLVFEERKEAAELLAPYQFDREGKMTGIYPLVQILQSGEKQAVKEIMTVICPEGWVEEACRVIKWPRRYFPVFSRNVEEERHG